MKTYHFTLFLQTPSGTEYSAGSVRITAASFKEAREILNTDPNIPYYHFFKLSLI